MSTNYLLSFDNLLPVRISTRFFVVWIIAWLGHASVLRADIVIDEYSDALHDRFTNSASFILNHQDLSGVGQVSNGRWVTAVSRNVVMTAQHFRPSIGQSVYFFPGNDPDTTPVVREVVGGTRVAGTDIHMAVLDRDLPDFIKHYTYATEPLSGTPPKEDEIFVDNAGIYQDRVAYVFGPFAVSTNPRRTNRFAYNDQAVGRNMIAGYSENVPFQSNTNNDSIILLHEDSGEDGHVQYEARVRGGDSGGPLFVEINGELRLLGVNSFLFDNDVGAGMTYTGNQASVIQSFINDNASIPEPSLAFGVLISAVCAGMARVRTRRRVGKFVRGDK